MNIVKANAFSNQAGIVVDTFYFTDRFRTLELNMQEWERFKRSIIGVLAGRDRPRPHAPRSPAGGETGATKVKVDTQVEFDNTCSARSTLIQVIAQDRPGLLHGSGLASRTKMQYRDRAHRYRRADGDRRLLSHLQRTEAHTRASAASEKRVAGSVADGLAKLGVERRASSPVREAKNRRFSASGALPE